jgi:hypothetical protein
MMNVFLEHIAIVVIAVALILQLVVLILLNNVVTEDTVVLV